nr:reverse transcriptase domain-containing protein [Tanacetum cinerariifolium]
MERHCFNKVFVIANRLVLLEMFFEFCGKAPESSNKLRGKWVVDNDLKKPFKEAVRTPHPKDHRVYWSGIQDAKKYPVMFQQTLDGLTRGWFERLPANSIDEWSELREAFKTRYSVRKACFKEPHEIKKILKKANESIKAFKKRWMVETGFILGVPEVMKISSFIDSLKCPELAKPFSVKTPKMMDEMMARVDDFVRLEEAFSCTELSKGETGEQHIKTVILTGRREERPYGHIEVITQPILGSSITCIT